jgi:processive 1,2-diacylglycerol beta-glucosyltransferase
MPGFAQPPPAANARARLGLDPARPVVLVLGGGLGLGVDAVAGRLLASRPDAEVVIMTGHNRPAHSALESRAAARHLRVIGWTDEMELFIRAADLVVGKPGGLTVAEVLACGRPLLATRSLGGQEGFNVRFLEQHGVGRLVTEHELPACVDAWLGNAVHLAELQHRAWALGKRDGAARVAATALAYTQAAEPNVAAGEPA